MIRVIEAKELPEFVGLAKVFYEKMGLPDEFNPELFCNVWNNLIASGSGFIIARLKDNIPQEAIGVIVHPDTKTGAKSACTDFWFFAEEPQGLEAGLLHDALEFDCRHAKVKRLHIEALCDPRLPRVGGYLLRNGFKLKGMVYTKEL